MKNRILAVDDNVNLTTLLAKSLGRLGYEVHVENDSLFALDTVRRVRPEVILLDVMMPGRDGGQVLRDLRADADLRFIPVILLTGIAREAQSLAGIGGIESVVLPKPVPLRELTAEINRHVPIRPMPPIGRFRDVTRPLLPHPGKVLPHPPTRGIGNPWGFPEEDSNVELPR